MTDSKTIASSKSIAIQLGGKQAIATQLLGESPINPQIIKSYDDYEAIYKKRHDLIHSVVCDKLGVKFGEVQIDEIMRENNIIMSGDYYEEVKKQTPDYFGIQGKTAIIYEMTVSNDSRAKNRKAAKYALLCKVLKDNGFEVVYKIYVFVPNNIYINRDEHLRQGLDDTILDFADTICKNTSHLLRAVHRTNDGRLWYDSFYQITEASSDLKYSPDIPLETHNKLPNKCFHSDDDLKKILFDRSSSMLSENDEIFMRELLDRTKKLSNPITEREKFQESEYIDYMASRSNTREYRSSMPMCFINPRIDDSSIRSTSEDFEKLQLLCGHLIRSENTVLSTMGYSCQSNLNQISKKPDINNNDFLFVCKFSEEEKRQNGLEGPGRKHYIKRLSQEHKKEDDRHSGYALHPSTDVRDIESISFLLSERDKIKETGDIFKDTKSLSEMTGVGLNYLKLCQTIFREININAMRGDRRHKMIIKPTGAEGVYIALYPGTKLRCGEMVNLVWYKIIVINEHIVNDMMYSTHWIFKKMIRDKFVSYTDWLSCDVHRLDHYIRCYDKVLMCYISMASQRFRSLADENDFTKSSDDEKRAEDVHSLIKNINNDDTNMLGLMILIYLEDKRSTSKMLQNVRYLVMTSISIYPKFNSVMDKFKDPIRSPLQLYLIRKLLDFIQSMKSWKPANSVKFGQVKYDYKTHIFLDMMGGSNIRLPRPLVSSSSGYAEFSEILSEMYFTMLFNKNQDDPTHASFQILNKILEGEDNFQRVKGMGMHLGYDNDLSDIEFADKIIENPMNHMFSRLSIEIGSKLLRLYQEDDTNNQIIRSVRNSNLNKTIDEFATFKSSSKPDNLYYDPMKGRQNSRRRCVEGVFELLSQGLKSSFDVVENVKDELTYFDVFKKNQIGGVREILILPITTRIKINVLETLSRNICKFDRREVLTHGTQKNESIKAVLYSSKKLEGTRAPIHLTFDKSKWGPSFVPIQFIYLYTPFKKELGTLFPYLVDLLIRHQNKKCMMPDRLMTAWFRDEKNVHKHDDPRLQLQKNKFLKDKMIEMENESNMGQGILHYTSSLLHLCMINFRDRLYKMWCDEIGLNSQDHDDLLSSDDSYTIFCPEISRGHKKNLVAFKLDMFLKCQRMSELMFNCRTSMVKSSINPLIGEFNSLFLTNMSFVPTLLKFSMSSVHPPNTDSFYRMVKESFGACRQIVENGGGLDIYLIASYLNKKYCEDLYHTSSSGVNNLEQFGVNRFPYHIGCYPIFNPSLMVIFGPEYYNYKLFMNNWDSLNQSERRLFMSSHKIIKGGLVETMAEFEDGDTILGGLMRIEANIGPIKQLERLRRGAPLDRDQLEKMLVDDPIKMIKRPKSIEDVTFRCVQKLYTNGSKEALKMIASSIFYGRVSATVSANAFYIPNGDLEKKTYKECLNHLINVESPVINMRDHIKFIYPKHGDYDMFLKVDDVSFKFFPRHPFEIQTVQTLVTHKIYTKLTQTVETLLSYKWENKPIPDHLISKVERDFILMKHHFPLIKDSISETMDQFVGSDTDKTKSVLLLVLKLFSLRDKNFKGVIYGMGSNDIGRTYDVLLERNLSNAYTTELIKDYELVRSSETFDKIFCAHNQTILSFFGGKIKSNLWDKVSERELIIFFQDPRINRNIKKRVFMCAVTNGYIENSDSWSNRVGIILHYWHLKQQYKEGKYTGSFDITLYMGSSKLNYYYDDRKKEAIVQKSSMDDPDLLYNFFQELSELLNESVERLLSLIKEKGNWVMTKEKIIRTTEIGFKMYEMENVNPILYTKCVLNVDEKWTRLTDSDGYKIFSIETGLLSADYTPSDEYDFKVFGLSFIDICKLGAFNQNFKVFYKSRDQCLESLSDLNVNKPIITQQTKDRLRLKDDWDIRDPEDSKDEVYIEDNTDIIGQLMDVEISSESLHKLIQDTTVDDELSGLLDFIMSTDAIYSMKTTQRIQHTRKIFDNIKHLKYDLIIRNVLLDMKINRQVLHSAGSIFRTPSRKFILYSLISYYDRLYQYENQHSPGGIVLDVYQNFINRFDLSSSDEEFAI